MQAILETLRQLKTQLDLLCQIMSAMDVNWSANIFRSRTIVTQLLQSAQVNTQPQCFCSLTTLDTYSQILARYAEFHQQFMSVKTDSAQDLVLAHAKDYTTLVNRAAPQFNADMLQPSNSHQTQAKFLLVPFVIFAATLTAGLFFALSSLDA